MAHLNENESELEATPSSLSLGDIYFVLFRHKWKILFFSFLGLLAAGGVYLTRIPKYASEAKLLIRYVIETKSENPVGPDSQVKTPDTRGDSIISSEREILSSQDLAQKVAELVGPEKIVPQPVGPRRMPDAVAYLIKNIEIDVPRNSTIIRLGFTHSDPGVAREVLVKLVDVYFKKHLEIHRSMGLLDDYLQQQTDKFRSSLAATEEELHKAKTNSGIINIEDSRKAISDQMTKIRTELYTAESDLAERQAMQAELEKLSNPKPDGSTNTFHPAPIDKISQYKALCNQLEAFRKKEIDLITLYKDEHPQVKSIREQISSTETQKRKMEAELPQLAMSAIASPDNLKQGLDPVTEASRLSALKSKVEFLKGQLEKIRADASGFEQAEVTIRQLERKKELEETNLKYYSASWEQYRLTKELGPGKVSNISIVQAPSVAARSPGKTLKTMGMAAGGGIGFGLVLAFLFELFVDQSVKRSKDLEIKLNIPVSLSIPRMNGQVHMQGESVSQSRALEKAGNAKIAPWSPDHPMYPYFEALRDRVTQFCDKMTHKPKLVGVTSCNRGAGVSTLAAGLASTLSQTGDGKVLLVDMNPEQGAAHAFFEGKPAAALMEGLEEGTRNNALVQENLYVVRAASQDPRFSVLPRKFANLMPKFKASDYDYIIFDLPAVNQTSITPRLAGLLDMVMMVVEAEKTSSQAVKKASARLSESKNHVTAVLNKCRTYVPSWLHEEV